MWKKRRARLAAWERELYQRNQLSRDADTSFNNKLRTHREKRTVITVTPRKLISRSIGIVALVILICVQSVTPRRLSQLLHFPVHLRRRNLIQKTRR